MLVRSHMHLRLLVGNYMVIVQCFMEDNIVGKTKAKNFLKLKLSLSG